MIRRLSLVFAFFSVLTAVVVGPAQASVAGCLARCGEIVGDYHKCTGICGTDTTKRQ